MTDQRVPEPSSASDPLSSDPLADDYGSVLPPAPGASAIPPAPSQRPSSPDPTADRFSAFDDPTSSDPVAVSAPARPPKGGSRKRSRKKPPGGGSATAATTRPTAQPSPSVPTPQRSRVARGVLVVVGALVLLPIVVGFALSRVVGDSDSDSPGGTADPADRTLAVTEVSASPTPIAPIPDRVDTLRIELQGPGRTADVRLYTPDGRNNLRNRVLPYAVDVPVSTDDAYLSVSADDYGYRGSQPMRCTISVGDTVLSTAVGTQDVECKVTDHTWSRVR